MEKRVGSILILVHDKSSVNELNQIISQFAEIIIGRQGLPVQGGSSGLISLVIEGSTDQMAALTGKIGRLRGIKARSVVLKINE